MRRFALTKGHSTTASIRVSKTLDRGSIPRAPAKTMRQTKGFSHRALRNKFAFSIAEAALLFSLKLRLQEESITFISDNSPKAEQLGWRSSFRKATNGVNILFIR